MGIQGWVIGSCTTKEEDARGFLPWVLLWFSLARLCLSVCPFVCWSVCMGLSVSVCACLRLSASGCGCLCVSVCLCLSVSVWVCLCLSVPVRFIYWWGVFLLILISRNTLCDVIFPLRFRCVLTFYFCFLICSIGLLCSLLFIACVF